MYPKLNIDNFHHKAISDFALRGEWPEDVLIQTKTLEDGKILEDGNSDLAFVTIDGADAKDFDDAIFCERRNKNFILKVAIADVSFFVKPGSPLDTEAQKRATSVYMPKKVLPMIPKKLSNDLCSLVPYQPRRVLVAEIVFDADGELLNYNFVRTSIRSVARLTYDEVNDFFTNGFPVEAKFVDSLTQSKILFQKLSEKRATRGALDFTLPEPYFTFEQNGEIKNVRSRSRGTSHRIIEEFMLIANICAADFLKNHYQKSIRRIHDYPDAQKIERLSNILKKRGINWEGSPEDLENLSIFLKNISKRPDAQILNTLILQSMQRAEYSTKKIGHFGLMYKNYTHFTSPIRRYPDLLVHRMIISILEKIEFDSDFLEDLLVHCSERERSAEFASKQVLQNLLCEHAKKFSGHRFHGFISGVQEYGLFVEIPKLFTSGMLHISEMPTDNYKYDSWSKTLKGNRRGNNFNVGDQIEVEIGNINAFEGKISLHY